MAIKDISIGNDTQQFILTYNPENNLPGWVTTVDELWMISAGKSVYNFFTDHLIQLKNSNLKDPKNFAAALPYDLFKDGLSSGELNRLRAYICTLYDVLKREHDSENVYICFFANNDSPHFISAMIINYGKDILLNVKLDNSPIDIE